MKLTKKSQRMMDILEEYFSDVTFADPVATLAYDDRKISVTQELYDYDYGGADRKEGPRSPEAARQHKLLQEFLKNIDPVDVEVEIGIDESNSIQEGFDLIMDSKEEGDCFFDNLC